MRRVPVSLAFWIPLSGALCRFEELDALACVRALLPSQATLNLFWSSVSSSSVQHGRFECRPACDSHRTLMLASFCSNRNRRQNEPTVLYNNKFFLG